MTKGYISDNEVEKPVVATSGKAGVTKTLEYAYDDYALALLAKELGDTNNYEMLMKRSHNYKNVFDPTSEFMRGRAANGDWIKKFDPQYPDHEYVYRKPTPGNRPFRASRRAGIDRALQEQGGFREKAG